MAKTHAHPDSIGPFIKSMYVVPERVRSWDEYPFTLPAVKAMDKIQYHPKVTYFVGENGSGKSTLLEGLAVALGFNPEGGSKSFRFATRESHSWLGNAMRVGKVPGKCAADSFFLRAESFYNVATEIEKLGVGGAYGSKSLHEQSHGESFMKLFGERFQGRGLYLLDEPEAALSPQKQMTFLAILHNYVKQGSQFVIATHSPILMAYPESTIYMFSTDGISEIAYEQTDHYQITKNFLNRTERMLKILMNEDEG